MAQLRIGCVVMAAGNASRFGDNKLAVQVQGKALFHPGAGGRTGGAVRPTVVVSQYPEACLFPPARLFPELLALQGITAAIR